MRPKYSFPEPVVEAIARDRYGHPDPRVQERMEILWLKSKNESHGRIAELANVSRSTVQRTLQMFASKGLDGVRSFGWKGQRVPLPRSPSLRCNCRCFGFSRPVTHLFREWLSV